MENFDDIDEPVVLSPVGRKKRANSANSARSVSKQMRHSGAGRIASISCVHKARNVCMATSLSEDDLKFAHSQFYTVQDKLKQDATLLSYMDIQKCVRRRAKVEDVEKRNARECCVKYCTVTVDKVRVPVCKASFMSIFGE